MALKKFVAVLLLLAMLMGCCSAEEKKPIRVARLPLMIKSYFTPDDKTMDNLETKIDRAIHVPFADILDSVIYLPEGECESKLEAIVAEQRKTARKGRVKMKDVVKPLAKELDADIVICPVLTAYEERMYMSFRWDRGAILYASAGVRITGYDRKTDKVFDKERYRHYHDEYSVAGEARALALECMDGAIEDTELRTRIPSMKEWLAQQNKDNGRNDKTEGADDL